MTILKDSINGVNLFVKNIILFLFISLVSAIVSFYAIPYLINSNITEESINQELSAMEYGADLFSPEQIIVSIVSSMQFLLISTVLLIIAYITKYIIDKRLFDIKRWRDWKFLIYVSGITFLEMYVLGNIFSSLSTSFIGSVILMVLYSFVTVVASAILLPRESK
ncbi:MAG: hypothetical protein WC386_00965 [Candidatus Paceibacterota bacterium]|jgi:hypothetical protein